MLKQPDEPNTKDIYSQPIQATTKPIKAVDKYAPTLQALLPCIMAKT